jgi:hypothetical protein
MAVWTPETSGFQASSRKESPSAEGLCCLLFHRRPAFEAMGPSNFPANFVIPYLGRGIDAARSPRKLKKGAIGLYWILKARRLRSFGLSHHRKIHREPVYGREETKDVRHFRDRCVAVR